MSKEIPIGFERKKFGEVVSLEYGSALSEKVRTAGQYPVFGSNGVVGTHHEYLVEGPGIVVGRKGSVGSITWTDKNFWPIDTTYYVKPLDGHNLGWLFYLLKSQKLESLSLKSGVPGLNRADVYRSSVELPCHAMQAKIVEILSSVDEALEASKAVLEQLKTIKFTLIRHFFIRDAGDSADESYFHPKLGWIPKTWKVKRLDEVADIERGKFSHRPRNDPAFYGGKYPFIQTGDVVKSNGSINAFTQTLNQKGFEVSREFAAGTIVMTIAANIGDTAILQFPSCFPDSLVGITPKEEVLGPFLHYYLMTLKDYLTRLAPESAQKNINLQVLRPLLIPLPSIDEQIIFLDALSSLDQRVYLESLNIDRIGTVKQGLMQQLLTGKLRVAVDDG